ncbi:hypothetical protein ANCDUO_00594 [Ancylostoma duodenale]|uniref:WD domain, G-beta repeat protein n=1 Tax=Ancylostoma duodenale TaxID=51022 RepID=A0A0C2E153_9BILA|nr:hypothetical protein ANCDUO_00594 [Ancylostoma duodenale]
MEVWIFVDTQICLMALSGPKAKRLCPEHTKGMLDDDEEEHLAKKLFGDNHVVLEESSDDEDTVVEQEVSSASVWHDDDDEDDEVQVPKSKSAVFLQRSSDSGGCVAADKQKTKRKADDSDDEVEDVLDEMTRSAQRYVDKDPFLVKDIVSTFRWPDITVGHHDTKMKWLYGHYAVYVYMNQLSGTLIHGKHSVFPIEHQTIWSSPGSVPRPINVVLFHNVRPVVLTAGSSGKVQLFRVGDRSDSGNFLQNIQFSNFPVTSMSLMQGGCSVICGSIRQDYLMEYDLEKGSVMQLFLPKCIPRQNAGRFAVSYDGSLLAMIAHSSQVHVLSSSSMELVKTLSAPTDVTSLQFLPGSSRELWAMTERGEVVIWSLQGSQHVFRDEGAVRGTKIRLSPDGSKVACGSNTGIVNVYDVTDVRKSTDPKPSTVASNLVTSCDSIAFNHDSQVMAFSSNVKKNQIKLLHVASSTVFNNFPKKHEKMTNIECAEFSPHSAYLGIGCSNGQLILERLNHFEDY